jgi:stage III sporulation protein AA
MSRELVLRHFRGEIKTAIERMSESDFSRCQEIRLRADRSLSVFAGNELYILSSDGHLRLAGNSNNSSGISVRGTDIKFTFESICQYSVHSFSRQIREGYITVAGGHRAGFCGTAVAADEALSEPGTVKNISAINFRVAREVKGAADELLRNLRKVLSQTSSNGVSCTHSHTFLSDFMPSVLICGGVGSGKTTLLRDLSRQAGDRMKVSLIDCRGELAAVSSGIPAHDVGAFTDIFDGYDKGAGIETAVRVMSPALIVCDEIGTGSDIEALRYAKLSGVEVLASVHARNPEDVFGRGIPSGMFDFAVFLKGSSNPTEIREIIDFGETQGREQVNLAEKQGRETANLGTKGEKS